MKKVLFILVAVALTQLIFAQKKIVVDPNGSGDFKTIQEAINSLEVSSNTQEQSDQERDL
jgi:uncharacterized protein YxeA